MHDIPKNNNIDKDQVTPDLPSASPDTRGCIFRGSEVFVIFLIFFAVVLALQIEGFVSPMIYDSVGWIEGRSYVFEKGPLAVAGIMPQRPLFMLSLYFNYLFHGMDPAYFRVFNALILAGTGVALMVMLNMIMALLPTRISWAAGEERLIIFLIGLLYIVHPLQIFDVLYIWQRETLMACLFYFSALAVYAAGRGGSIRNPATAYSLTVILFFLGLLSKETVITLPLTIVLMEFVFFRAPMKKFVKRAVAIWIIALIPFVLYLFLSYYLHGPDSTSAKPFERLSLAFQESGIGPLNVILTEPRVWLLYMASIVVPSVSNLQLVRAMEVSASLIDPPSTLFACLTVAGLIALAFTMRSREPLVCFGLLFFCVVLLPESLLLPQYLFFGYRAILPMAGLMFILARIMNMVSAVLRRKLPLTSAKAALAAAMCGVVAYLGMMTCSMASRWGPLWIWEHSLTALPAYSPGVETSPYLDILMNYSIQLTKSGDYGRVVEVLQRASEVAKAAQPPKRMRVLLNLGNALAITGNRQEAIERFKEAIQVDPRWAPPYNTLGGWLQEFGDLPGALENFRTAVRLDPSLAQAHYRLGRALLLIGDSDNAILSLQKALELEPNYPEASAHLGMAMWNLNRVNEAVHYLETAVSVFPNHVELHNILAKAYSKLGMVQQAEQHFKRVLEIEPGYQDARRNLQLLSPSQSK